MSNAHGQRPAAFVDRDGTINVERHYLSDPDELELLPQAVRGLRVLHDAGYALVVVTNQSGIARGYFDRDRLEEIHSRLVELLAAENVKLDGIYVCPHGPNDGCSCRKPLPGMPKKAAEELQLDLSQSVVIGDKIADVGLGKAIGATSILVRTGHGLKEEVKAADKADYVADDLFAAATWFVSNR